MLREELLFLPPFGERDGLVVSTEHSDSIFLLPKPRGKGWKKKNMVVVDLAGISTGDVVPLLVLLASLSFIVLI